MNRERKTNMNQSGFIYGGDYNPEQWLAMPEILEQDIEYMKEAHINEVTLGVFPGLCSSRRRVYTTWNGWKRSWISCIRMRFQ